jgi:hypothetical protein
MWSPKIVNFKLKISSTQRGEDKGEGEINTLLIAGCLLRIGKTKNWIPAGSYT